MSTQPSFSLDHPRSIFFIGVAGTGMSALAQYLSGSGHTVAGSDRYFSQGEAADIREKLEASGIRCHPQDESGLTDAVELVVVSTAIEEQVPEVRKTRAMGIPILRRSELLALLARQKKTIAIGGTSGKSTTSGMLFDILSKGGLDPGIISGAGLVSLIRKGFIGTAHVGRGEWLIIEADESDGSIVQYEPEIGLLLNIDKDHQEIDTLMEVFATFRANTRGLFCVNRSHPLSARLSVSPTQDFAHTEASGAGYVADEFRQEGLTSQFQINGYPYRLLTPGRHNMENALAAVCVARQLGVADSVCAEALLGYEGIYRRHQVIGEKDGVVLIDDYAHNPVKCAASIAACQPIAPRVVAWFQPHGYGPTRFLKADFIHEIAQVLRDQDEIWMSEIFYAGGSAVKDISAADLIEGIRSLGKNAFFVEDRKQFTGMVRPHLQPPCVLLLMGARDPSLETFATSVWEQL